MTDGAKEGYGWSQEMSISLYDKLKKDLKNAMIQKDPSVRDTMRQIMAEFPKLTVPLILESGKKSTRPKKPDEITDDDNLGTCYETFRQAGRRQAGESNLKGVGITKGYDGNSFRCQTKPTEAAPFHNMPVRYHGCVRRPSCSAKQKNDLPEALSLVGGNPTKQIGFSAGFLARP